VVHRVTCLHRYSVVPNFSTGSNLLAAPFGRLKVAALLSGAGGSFGTLMIAWDASSCICVPPVPCNDLAYINGLFSLSPFSFVTVAFALLYCIHFHLYVTCNIITDL